MESRKSVLLYSCYTQSNRDSCSLNLLVTVRKLWNSRAGFWIYSFKFSALTLFSLKKAGGWGNAIFGNEKKRNKHLCGLRYGLLGLFQHSMWFKVFMIISLQVNVINILYLLFLFFSNILEKKKKYFHEAELGVNAQKVK